MPGFPAHHQLLKLTQTHVHWVDDAIQPSHLLCPLLLPSSIFPSIRAFPMSQFFASGSQSIGVSAWASVLPMNIQDWFPLGWTVWSPCSPRDSQDSSPTPQFKSINSSRSAFFIVQLSHSYTTTGKTIALSRQTFVSKVMSLLFNMLSKVTKSRS